MRRRRRRRRGRVGPSAHARERALQRDVRRKTSARAQRRYAERRRPQRGRACHARQRDRAQHFHLRRSPRLGFGLSRFVKHLQGVVRGSCRGVVFIQGRKKRLTSYACRQERYDSDVFTIVFIRCDRSIIHEATGACI